MLLTAGKYTNVRAVQTARRHPEALLPQRPTAPQVFVPTLKANPQLLQDWYWRELRSGFFFNYLMRERARSQERLRAVARSQACVRQNNKSDFVRRAAIPMREYMRWKAQDPDFFSDDNNLRSFKRDNPDAVVHVGPHRYRAIRKVYGPRNAGETPATTRGTRVLPC